MTEQQLSIEEQLKQLEDLEPLPEDQQKLIDLIAGYMVDKNFNNRKRRTND